MNCFSFCLFLSLAPVDEELMLQSRKLPVLLFVHGDSLLRGSGNSVDASLISFTTNIIVITINYRLGVLGKCPACSVASQPAVRSVCHAVPRCVVCKHWASERISLAFL